MAAQTPPPISTDEIVTALAGFPSNGRPPADDRAYLVWLHMEEAGLISSKTTETPCRTCGKPRVTGSWHSITPAGRLVLEISGMAPRRPAPAALRPEYLASMGDLEGRN